ncbi:diguanylate cyclase [Virgibacillus byunsanensis]|uniref:Diguanylate cyclase n=1 Tax=Virgibacillus byunsanensis TaxID=570945 RepID=A0ABW3LN49_9BACI
MVAKRKIYMLWIASCVLWPFILWLSYEYYYINVDGQLIDIVLFAIFMCIVALFPLTINNNQIFFVNGISLAVFLTFGLFVEIILTQLAIIIVLLTIGLSKKDAYRFPLNMLMFSIISIIAAGVYTLIGGEHGAVDYQSSGEIVAIFGYAITVFIVNQFLNKMIDSFFYKRKVKLFDRGLIWEFTSSLLVIPVGFVLLVLYSEIGRSAIVFMGIPFVFISVILMLLYSYQKINKYLERTSDIGHQLAKRLEVTQVYDVFIEQITNLLPIDYAYIYTVSDDGDTLELKQYYDVNHNTESDHSLLEKNEAISGKVWYSGEPIMFKRRKEWSSFKSSKIPVDSESVLSLPVEYGDNIKGVVTIVSRQRKAYEKFHFQLLDILTNYLGVAVENARNYEETKSKSEKDGLTQLYNYRYFEDMLEKYFETVTNRVQEEEYFSLILLDLDHFKMTNDTYGHEAGNEVLCQMAQLLQNRVGGSGVIARYGGEEFVVFLPHVNQEKASSIAESLRQTISNTAFSVHNHIFSHNETIQIYITASIGVASYPDHCDTPSELIRHADRAMYIGAKQKGRNKVAVYEEMKTS